MSEANLSSFLWWECYWAVVKQLIRTKCIEPPDTIQSLAWRHGDTRSDVLTKITVRAIRFPNPCRNFNFGAWKKTTQRRRSFGTISMITEVGSETPIHVVREPTLCIFLSGKGLGFGMSTWDLWVYGKTILKLINTWLSLDPCLNWASTTNHD